MLGSGQRINGQGTGGELRARLAGCGEAREWTAGLLLGCLLGWRFSTFQVVLAGRREEERREKG